MLLLKSDKANSLVMVDKDKYESFGNNFLQSTYYIK